MNYLLNKNQSTRGEASIIFVFVILMIIMVSALTVTMMSVTTLKNASVAENSAKAQFVVDSVLEEALTSYAWSGATPVCTRQLLSDVDYKGQGVNYTVDTYSVDLTDINNVVVDHIGCPAFSELSPTGKNLCILVTAEKNGVQKKYLSGPNPQCLN